MTAGSTTANPVVVNNLVGVDFTKVDASGAASFKVGTVAHANDGSRYMYVKSTASSFSARHAVVVSTAGEASLLTSTNGANAHLAIGFVVAAMTAGQYGWIYLSGPSVPVRAISGSTPNAVIYASATAGDMNNVTASGLKLLGVRLISTATGTAATTAVVAVSGVVVYA